MWLSQPRRTRHRFSSLGRVRLQFLEERVTPTTFVVNNLLDGPVTKAGDLPGSLRQAIFDANVNPGADVVDAMGVSGTIVLAANGILITESLTIEGPTSGNLVVDGQNKGGVIAIYTSMQNQSVSLSRLTITNGKSDFRGGISCLGANLTLIDCVVTGNTSTDYVSEGGGGIYCNSSLVLIGCAVTNNRANYESGGGISVVGSNSKLEVRNCTIGNNWSAVSGGGIYVVGSTNVVILDSVISGNTAEGFFLNKDYGGGGAFIQRTTTIQSVTIQNCSFVDNYADMAGGGLRLSFSNSLTILESTFARNTCTTQGGGVYAAAGSVTLRQCSVTGNSAGTQGGGLYLWTDALVEDSVIANNNSKKVQANTKLGGGGLWLKTGGAGFASALTLHSSAIVGNTSFHSGGGVFADMNATLTVQNSTITGNVSGNNGGGVYFFNGGGLLVEHSTIGNNTANGIASTAVYGGGGIYFWGAPAIFGMTIRNSTVSGNSTKAAGGGIVLVNVSGTLQIQNSTITDNTAATNGGGIARVSGSASISLTSTIIANNHHATTPDISTSGTVTADHSLIGVTNGITTLTATKSLTGTLAAPLDPLLAPLADNGGPTKTHVPLPGSPAINKGSNPLNLTYDQRGPGYPRQAGIAHDIGAFEFPLPPVVNAVTIADGTAQRSMIRSLTVTFSEAVTFPFGAAAFQLQRTGPGGPTGLVNLAFAQVGTVVTLSFDDPVFAPAPGKSLIDGNYSLTLISSKIQGAAGLLDGNGDGIPGGNVSTTFHRLFGDSNGDRRVTAIDFNAFRLAWSTNNTAFDFNNDGIISALDFQQFRLRYGMMV